MSAKTDRKQLSLRQAFELRDWLQRNSAELQAEQYTFEKVAEMASKELDYPISHRQLRRTVEEAGMAWKPKRVRSRPVDDRVSELEQRLSKFDHQLGELSSLLTMTSEHLDSQLALLRGAVTVVAEHINIAPSRTGLAATNANKTCLAGSKV